MTIGTRLTSCEDGAYRPGHTFGNRLFIALVRILFGVQTRDLFSGYRAFTQRFLMLSPLIAQGFELEAELSMQALAGSFVVTEVPVHYRARGEGSVSKLSTTARRLSHPRRVARVLPRLPTAHLLRRVRRCSSGSAPRSPAASWSRSTSRPARCCAFRSPSSPSGSALLGAISFMGGLFLSSVNRRSQQLAALILRR